MAKTYRIIHGYYEGDGEQNVCLTLVDGHDKSFMLSYERFPDDGNELFDDEDSYRFVTWVNADDIRDLYLALSTGDDIARSFYSVDGSELIMVNVDDGAVTMKIVTAAGEEITSDFDPLTDDVSYMQNQIRWFLEEVK